VIWESALHKPICSLVIATAITKTINNKQTNKSKQTPCKYNQNLCQAEFDCKLKTFIQIVLMHSLQSNNNINLPLQPQAQKRIRSNTHMPHRMPSQTQQQHVVQNHHHHGLGDLVSSVFSKIHLSPFKRHREAHNFEHHHNNGPLHLKGIQQDNEQTLSSSTSIVNSNETPVQIASSSSPIVSPKQDSSPNGSSSNTSSSSPPSSPKPSPSKSSPLKHLFSLGHLFHTKSHSNIDKHANGSSSAVPALKPQHQQSKFFHSVLPTLTGNTESSESPQEQQQQQKQDIPRESEVKTRRRSATVPAIKITPSLPVNLEKHVHTIHYQRTMSTLSPRHKQMIEFEKLVGPPHTAPDEFITTLQLYTLGEHNDSYNYDKGLDDVFEDMQFYCSHFSKYKL